MKYCVNCGAEIADDAAFCSKCGRPVNVSYNYSGNSYNNNYQAPQSSSPSVLSIIGLVLSFFMTIIGLVISIVAYTNAKNENDYKSQGLAKAGIIVAAVEIGLSVLAVILYFVIFGLIIGGAIVGGGMY